MQERETITDLVGELHITYKRDLSKTPIKIDRLDQIISMILPFYKNKMDYLEEVKVMYLSNQMAVQSIVEHRTGTDSACVVDIKDIMRQAIFLNSKTIILFHNHPSGNLDPSKNDIALTDKLRHACNCFDMHLNAHYILASEGYHEIITEKRSAYPI